jgi:hypothetical protein
MTPQTAEPGATAQRGQSSVLQIGVVLRVADLNRSAKHMWKRKNREELRHLARAKEGEKKSPFFALLCSAVFATIVTVAWSLGISGKFSHRPDDPKTLTEIQQSGPLYFIVMLAVFFFASYCIQRLRGRSLVEPEKQALICPRCFTPQHKDDRKCGCSENLEPLENWKWV